MGKDKNITMKEFKPVILSGHLFFVLMFVFAIVFYIERIAYIDTSFYMFKILIFKTFNIEAYRYSAIITQILPLLAIKLKLNLKYVIISYSVSFVLIYYLIFLINVYLFKSAKGGIATSLVMILGVSDSAFFPATEIELGVVLCILFYSYLEFYFQNLKSFTKIKKFLMQLPGIFIILLCLFCHPATLLPVLFILVFETINYKSYLNKTSWFLLIFIIAVYLIKLFSIDSSGYEGNKIKPLNNFLNLVFHLRSLYSVVFFLKYIVFKIYLLPLALMAFCLFYYFIKYQFLKFFYYVFAITGCFVFLMVYLSSGDSDIGMERSLLPLWVLAAVPFVHDLLLNKTLITSFRSVFIYGVIIFVASLSFYRATLTYTNRTDYVRQILKKASETNGGRKFIIEQKFVNMDVLIGNLSFANESLLISSIDGKDKSITIYLTEDVNQLKSKFDFQKKDVYLSVLFWLQCPYSSLNHDYFNLPDEPYIFVEENIPYHPKSKH